jgi:hypothetical protein
MPADVSDMKVDGYLLEQVIHDLVCNLQQGDIPWVVDTSSGIIPIIDIGSFEARLWNVY